tara:strand:- start:371 stop:976 length:606 start_codon:yes stop_codon:yes gene_type:complete
MDPLTALQAAKFIGAGVGVAGKGVSAIGGFLADRRQAKRDAQANRELGRELEAIDKDKTLGMSDAEIRSGTEEAVRSGESQTKSLAADAKRLQSAGRSGAAQSVLSGISKGAAKTAADARAKLQKQSDALAERRKAKMKDTATTAFELKRGESAAKAERSKALLGGISDTIGSGVKAGIGIAGKIEDDKIKTDAFAQYPKR